MARLPIPGSDSGSWGNILNGFLNQAHNADGSVKDVGVVASKYVKPSGGVPESDLSSGVQTKLNTGGSASSISFSPTGNISSSNVQSAIAEAASEAVQTSAVGAASGVATLDAASLIPHSQTGMAWNPRTAQFGALGNGVADDRVAIQAALDLAGVNGGDVYLPEGTYLVSLASHPDNASYQVGLRIPNGVHLRGAGRGATVIKLVAGSVGTTSGGVQAWVITNNGIGGGGSREISLSDLTVDGNCGNQTDTQLGVVFLRTTRARVTRVDVQDCRGTAPAGISETFHFDAQVCSDVVFADCTARWGGVGSVASGFSANGSTGIVWSNCVAVQMNLGGGGFTHNDCTDLMYVGCWAYLSGNGFNSEVSSRVTYVGCTSGGKATASAPHPLSANLPLSNGSGFILNGTVGAVLDGCLISNNTGSGVFATAGVTGRISNCVVTANAIGLNLNDDTTYAAFLPTLFTNTISGNTTADIGSPSAGYEAPSAVDVVRVKGAQTVNGTKTFTSSINAGASNYGLAIYNLADGIQVAAYTQAVGDTVARWLMRGSGYQEWGSGSATADTNLYRAATDTLKTDDKFIAGAGLGVGNSAAATTPGAVVQKIEVFDAAGASLGFIPVYSSIT